jgi:hypothetical protein
MHPVLVSQRLNRQLVPKNDVEGALVAVAERFPGQLSGRIIAVQK